MTAYCPNKLPGTEHTCLCTALAHHIGGHRCACGHTWGEPWHEMTYEQQRALLGLTLHYDPIDNDHPLRIVCGTGVPELTLEIGEAS